MTGNLCIVAGILAVNFNGATARAQILAAQPPSAHVDNARSHLVLKEPFNDLYFNQQELDAHPERFLDQRSVACHAFANLQKVGIVTDGEDLGTGSLPIRRARVAWWLLKTVANKDSMRNAHLGGYGFEGAETPSVWDKPQIRRSLHTLIEALSPELKERSVTVAAANQLVNSHVDIDDVPLTHWASDAMEEMHRDTILIGD